MPTYDFVCEKCGKEQHNVLLRITHDDADKPHCCNQPMRYWITTPPMVHWVDPVIEPFRAIATPDRPVIRTARENREYMARHDLVDANEVSPPPTPEEHAKTQREIKESIEKISPTKEMREQGISDIV